MGDYADWAVEDSIWGCPLGGYEYETTSYPKPKEVLRNIASFVGKKNDDTLKEQISNFAISQGFDESKPKNVLRAKYNFVWNRRHKFKRYVQSKLIRTTKTDA